MSGEFGAGVYEHLSTPEGKYEALTRPATGAKNITDYLKAHPFCQGEELIMATGLRYQTQFRELTYLTTNLLTIRTMLREAHSALGAMSGNNGMKSAEVLFEAASRKRNVGKVEMGYLKDPFALIIFTENDDFKKLHSPDAGGYCMKELRFWVGNRQFRTPFIAIKKDPDYLWLNHAVAHEYGHASMNQFEDAIEAVGKLDYWGTLIESRLERSSTMSGLFGEFEVGVAEGIRNSESWSKIMKHLLYRGKREALAILLAGQPFDQFDSLYNRRGSYDYFSKDFEMGSGSGVLGDMIWNRYCNIVRNEVGFVTRVKDAYSRFGIKSKVEILPWQLARIPLGRWQRTFKEIGIAREVDLLEKIDASLHKKSSRPMQKLKMMAVGQKDWRADKELLKIVSDSDHLIVRPLENYYQRLARAGN